MVIKDKLVDMDERVWRQLLALPYEIEVNDIGQIVMTSIGQPALTWEQLATTDPILPEDLDWRVETDAENRIIMSPAARDDHNRYGLELIFLLRLFLPAGRPFYETGVVTANGTKVPDVGWISAERDLAHRPDPTFHVAPEICVEIISPDNSRREIDEKARLYFGAGALEVWRCELDGKMNFFSADGPLEKSVLCPDFPGAVSPFT